MHKRILYITHVDWDWIKQRPHFLAEQLSRHFDVTVLYLFSLRRSQMTKNARQGLRLLRVINLPFQYDRSWLYRLNRLLVRSYFRSVVSRLRPDYVWLTHPMLYDYIPRDLAANLVYDCMDDVQAFDAGSGFYRERLLELEKQLIQKSSVVLASSNRLIGIANERQPCSDKTVLVRNAFGGSLLETDPEPADSNRNNYTISYVGTVASWFDFEAVLHCVERISNIEFQIVGPVTLDITPWAHKRIHFVGPVQHEELYRLVKRSDCMIMPFRLNDLVLSVDPIKLYDYVNYNKPIVCTRYGEVQRFSPFVNFYSSKEELLNILTQMISIGFPTKYTQEQRREFLKENSWEVRGDEVTQILEQLV